MSVEAVNQIEPNGSTALHVASYRGHEKIVELLLEKGASYSTKNKYNNTPLDEAKTEKIKEMIHRNMNKSRFVSDSLEWIIPTNDADFQAHQYMEKLEKHGKDPKFHEFIVYIKDNYIEKDLRHVKRIDKIKEYFSEAIRTKDPVYLIRVYTAETGFYSTLNVQLAKLRLEDLTNENNLSRAYYIGIIAFHPNFDIFSYTGLVYRGMVITNEDLKQYKKGTRILTKTFSSTSKQLHIALRCLNRNRDIGDLLTTICTYQIRNERTALGIEKILLFPNEKEVLILPYSAFKIIDIQIDKEKSPNVEIKLKECKPW